MISDVFGICSNQKDFLVPSLLCTSQFGLKEMHLKANGPFGYEILLSF